MAATSAISTPAASHRTRLLRAGAALDGGWMVVVGTGVEVVSV
jgi:hypothetical protein